MPQNTESSYLAAVRACGEGALLGGRAAAHLYALVKGRRPSAEVITPAERKIPGVNTTRSRKLDPRDATSFKGIPVTTVPRTLVDLAATLTSQELARACHEAGVLYRTTPAHVELVLARRPSAKGARNLRAIIHGDVRVTLSALEQAFIDRLKPERLPLPLTNKVTDGRRVDCRWPDHRLTVELHGYRFHNSRHSWEQDFAREREARNRGDDYRRFTYHDVFEDPTYMLTELRKLLYSGVT